MREKHFQIKFGHWVKAIWRKTGAFELKLTKTNSLPFDAVVPHQIQALYNAKHGVLFYKIPDNTGYQTPFDCFCLAKVPAFVVVKYVSGFAYVIDIDDFIKERDTSDRKSLTEERAKVINTLVIA